MQEGEKAWGGCLLGGGWVDVPTYSAAATKPSPLPTIAVSIHPFCDQAHRRSSGITPPPVDAAKLAAARRATREDYALIQRFGARLARRAPVDTGTAVYCGKLGEADNAATITVTGRDGTIHTIHSTPSGRWIPQRPADDYPAYPP